MSEMTELEQDPTPEATQEGTEDQQEADPAAKARREAKSLRERLRAAEAERDTHAGSVDALRKQLAGAELADVLAKPAALWETAGIDVAEFFDDTGALDREALRVAAKSAVKDHGLGPFKRFQGTADGGARDDGVTQTAVTWGDVFKAAT